MDALFGLPRKKMAGTSYCEPLHGELLFSDQSLVDEFVANNDPSRRAPDVSDTDSASIIELCECSL